MGGARDLVNVEPKVGVPVPLARVRVVHDEHVLAELERPLDLLLAPVPLEHAGRRKENEALAALHAFAHASLVRCLPHVCPHLPQWHASPLQLRLQLKPQYLHKASRGRLVVRNERLPAAAFEWHDIGLGAEVANLRGW